MGVKSDSTCRPLNRGWLLCGIIEAIADNYIQQDWHMGYDHES